MFTQTRTAEAGTFRPVNTVPRRRCAGREDFNAADARSRATHLRAGWSPLAETHPCACRCRGKGPEMPARRSNARPAAPPSATSHVRCGFAGSDAGLFFGFSALPVHGFHLARKAFVKASQS